MSFYHEYIVSCCGLPSVTRMVSRRMVFGPVATYDCDCNSLNWGLVSVDSRGRLRPVRQLLMLGLYMLMRVANVPATEDGLVYMGRTQASGSMADMISLVRQSSGLLQAVCFSLRASVHGVCVLSAYPDLMAMSARGQIWSYTQQPTEARTRQGCFACCPNDAATGGHA